MVKQRSSWRYENLDEFSTAVLNLIDRDRLNELSWPEHIAGKTWSNQSDFMQAWNFALQHWNVSFSPPDQELWERRKQRRASVAPVVPLRE